MNGPCRWRGVGLRRLVARRRLVAVRRSTGSAASGVPAAIVVVQVLLWPVLPVARGVAVPGVEVAVALAGAVLVGAALVWRRRAPVVVLAVVLVADSVAEFGTPPDALLLLQGTVFVALYSVVVHCGRRWALGCAAVVAGWQAVVGARTESSVRAVAASAVLGVALVVVTAVLGRVRRRWLAARESAATQLVRAEAERLATAGVERRRLARELHDVSASLLTSVVVSASAAVSFGDRHPTMVDQALEIASRAGREALDAVRGLVAVAPDPTEPPDTVDVGLRDLAAEAAVVGQRVVVRVAAEVTPEVAAAMYGITREALTNAVRHATGSQVRVAVANGPDGVELLVDDDGPQVAPHAGLGSGYGLTGARERAAAAGGTVEAGRRTDGGWRVRAVFPASAASATAGPVSAASATAGPVSAASATAGPVSAPSPTAQTASAASVAAVPAAAASRTAGSVSASATAETASAAAVTAGPAQAASVTAGVSAGGRRWGGWRLDAAVVLVAAGVPAALVVDGDVAAPRNPGATALLWLILLAHALPLLWRQVRPWFTLAAVLAGCVVLTQAASRTGIEVGTTALYATVAEAVAVFAVGAYAGGRALVTALSALVAGIVVNVAVVVAAARDGVVFGSAVTAVRMTRVLVAGSIIAALVFAVVWGAGAIVRRRRRRTLTAEDDALHRSRAAAADEARRERSRTAAGLRAEVEDHTVAVIAAADRKDLPAVLAEAREALAGMHAVLTVLRATPAEKADPAQLIRHS